MTTNENERQAHSPAPVQNREHKHAAAFNHGTKIHLNATPNPAAVAQLEVTPELVASIAAATKVEHAPRTLPEVTLEGLDDSGDPDDEGRAAYRAALAEGCRARANMYTLLARVYRVEVDAEFLRQLQSARYASNTGNSDIDEGYRMVARTLSGTWEHSLRELAKDYVRAFIGYNGDHASAAYPYESVFLSEKHLLMQDQRDEVLACYRASGLDKDGAWREPEDHIALEFEYMQALANRTAETLETDGASAGEGVENTALAQSLLRDQSHFLQDHLNQWVARFTGDVERFAATDFYRGFARVTRGWLTCENEFFAELGRTEAEAEVGAEAEVEGSTEAVA